MIKNEYISIMLLSYEIVSDYLLQHDKHPLIYQRLNHNYLIY